MLKLRQYFAIFIAYSLIYSQVFAPLVYAADIVIDGTTKTTLDTSRNGVDVVNIAKPSSKGLSHNKFKKFNVNQKGVILNNSGNTTVKTQLGGYIYGNKNLSGGSAKVILNEVTGLSKSYLRGYTEVAGQKADMVLVNPNGISLNGAGFINIPNLTLSTGNANIINGAIDSFSVLKGDISIEGQGLNTEAQQSTYVYSKTLQVNAKIHAQDLNIALGSNDIDYTSKAISSKDSQDAAADTVMLDSSALGGMYANRITLVGTDKGVGVNLPPEVLASMGDITITNDGKIQLADIIAKKDVKITSTDYDLTITGKTHGDNAVDITAQNIAVEVDGVIAGKDSVTLNTQAMDNRGTVTAGLNDDGSANYSGDLTVNATQLQNEGTIAAGNINTENITNTNGQITAKNITATGTINNTQGELLGDSNLTLNAASVTNSEGTIASNVSTQINATTLTNQNGTIESNGDTTIATSHLNNAEGTISATKKLSIDTQTIDLNNSTLYANENLNLKLNALDNIASSSIESNGDMTIEAQDHITNDSNLLANGSLTLKTDGTLTNNQTISSQSNLNIEANTLTNNGAIASGNTLTTNTTNLNNYQTLFSGGDMNLYTTGTLYNYAASNIFSLDNMVLAANESGAKSNRIVNDQATIETYDGDMTIKSKSLENIASNLIKSSSSSASSSYIPYIYINSLHRHRSNRTTTTIVSEWFDSDLTPANLLSGKNLIIDANNIIKGLQRDVV